MTEPATAKCRPLDAARPYKPLDVGEAGVAVSINARGGILALMQPHPDLGVVALAAGPGFPEAGRFDPGRVRGYRRRIASSSAPALEVRVGAAHRAGSHGIARVALLDDALPVTGFGPRGDPVVTFVPHPDDTAGVLGVVQLSLGGQLGPGTWGGDVWLGRAEYPELTEGHPLLPAPAAVEGFSRSRRAVIEDPGLGTAIAIAGDLGATDVKVARTGHVRVTVDVPTDARALILGLGADAGAAEAAAASLASNPGALLAATRVRWRRRWAGMPELGALDPVVRRGIAYALGCCVVPVRGAVCLTTDHRLLPLAWTRDGYFVARSLLDWASQVDSNEGFEVVRRHLLWLFEVADRPDGWWARSHLTHGQRKDPAFQLDQQVFPLLEVVDFVRTTDDREPLRDYGQQIERTLRVLEARRSPDGLFATEETPADDPTNEPYQTANQILVWRVFRELDALGVGNGRLGAAADRLRRAVYDRLVVPGPAGSPIFAYAADESGRKRLYHDANDVALSLAPRWGFCSVDDPIWAATIGFAFSPANPGFFDGPYGGLGSVHTPGTWPLGLVQCANIAELRADDATVADMSRRIVASSYWDGALPEASHPRTGRPISRPWFAWPGALVASMRLGGADSPTPSSR